MFQFQPIALDTNTNNSLLGNITDGTLWNSTSTLPAPEGALSNMTTVAMPTESGLGLSYNTYFSVYVSSLAVILLLNIITASAHARVRLEQFI